jgi:hypothetical protein
MSLSLLPLSQGHLNLFEACPRKFQYIFNDSLAVPPSPEQQASAGWGNQFHLLMQQQALGLPIEVMAAADADMMASVEALKQTAPDLFAADETVLRLSESQRSLEVNGYLLTVIYDWLVLSPQGGEIVDWKTYLRPPQREKLAVDWQTRLYLYVLTETSGLRPEQVSMTYWFVRHRDPQSKAIQPLFYRFSYSVQKHEQTRQDLGQLTQRLTVLRQAALDFPQVDLARGICAQCPFMMRCQRWWPRDDQPRPTPWLMGPLAAQMTVEEIDEVKI